MSPGPPSKRFKHEVQEAPEPLPLLDLATPAISEPDKTHDQQKHEHEPSTASMTSEAASEQVKKQAISTNPVEEADKTQQDQNELAFAAKVAQRKQQEMEYIASQLG